MRFRLRKRDVLILEARPLVTVHSGWHFTDTSVKLAIVRMRESFFITTSKFDIIIFNAIFLLRKLLFKRIIMCSHMYFILTEYI